MNGAGNKKWEVSNIRQVLTNEKSIGDALLQKTCTVSVLEKSASRTTARYRSAMRKEAMR